MGKSELLYMFQALDCSEVQTKLRAAKAWNVMKTHSSGNGLRIVHGGYWQQLKNLGRQVSPSQDPENIVGMAFPKEFCFWVSLHSR